MENRPRLLAVAQWHDVKFLVRKVTGCELKRFYVQRVEWGGDAGWLVEFKQNDYAEIAAGSVVNGIQIGNRAIWIGVVYV